MKDLLTAALRSLPIVLFGSAVMWFGGAAEAHPHVWAISKNVVVYKDGEIVGLTHDWRFDEGFTESVMPEFDANKDGKLTKEELSGLVKLNMEALKDFGFFTVARSGNATVAFDKPVDFSMVQDGKELVLTFTILFKEPLKPGQAFSFTVEDPTYFTFFTFAEKNGVSLGDGAPAGCAISLEKRETKSSADEKKLEDAFASELGAAGMGFGNAAMAHVRCGKAS